MKKISSVLLIMCFICNISLSAFANDDMTETYKDAFTHLNGQIITGYDETDYFYDKFDKSGTTRAEMAMIICNMLGVKPEQNEKSIFSDCTDIQWCIPYVNQLYNLNIVSGYGNNLYKPLSKITVYETVTMLVRALGYDTETNNVSYPDKYIEIANKLNLFANISADLKQDSYVKYGDLFIMLLNSMRSKVNNTESYLWTYRNTGNELLTYKEVKGTLIKISTDNDNRLQATFNVDEKEICFNLPEECKCAKQLEISRQYIIWETDNNVIDIISCE